MLRANSTLLATACPDRHRHLPRPAEGNYRLRKPTSLASSPNIREDYPPTATADFGNSAEK